MNKLETIFAKKKPIIGMVHLRPLPGSPLYDPASLPIKEVIRIAKEEAKILEEAGVDGLQVENIWDYPYEKGDISKMTVAALAVAVNEVASSAHIPVGVNCHMNGSIESLVAAIAGGAKWIRVFEWCSSYISQVGFVDSVGAATARMRTYLQAQDIVCMCDVNVKHGSHFIIHDRSVAEQAVDVESQGADVVIVTGFETGKAPTVEKVEECKSHISLPVILGSGVSTDNAADLLSVADGAIIGSWFKEDNNWKNPVSYDRTYSFMKEVERIRKEGN